MDLKRLLQAAIQGNDRSEEELLRHLSVRFVGFAVLRLGNKQDAEEVVQDTLAAIARDYKSVEYEVSFAAWAHKVLEHRVLKKLSSRKLRNSVVSYSEDLERLPDQSGSHGAKELKRKLSECLKKIGKANIRYARIINLHHLGYSANEIAGKLGITRDNCYMILSRARVQLRRCLDTGEIT